MNNYNDTRQFPFDPYGTGIGVDGFPGEPSQLPVGPGDLPAGVSMAQVQQILSQVRPPTTPPPQQLINLYNYLVSRPQDIRRIVQQRPTSLAHAYQLLSLAPEIRKSDLDNSYSQEDQRIDGIWFCRFRWTLIFYVNPLTNLFEVHLAWVAYVDPFITIGFCWPQFNPCIFFTPRILLALC